MKKHIVFSFVILLITSTTALSADRERKISRSFKVSPDTQVEITNSFGKVHINTWDKNQLELEISIIAKAKSEQTAQQILDNIGIDISESSGELEFTTEIARMNNKNGESFEVNYVINMPKSNPLEVKNSFGNFYLDDYDGPVELNLSYGALKIGNLNGPAEIEVSFNKGENIIQSMARGELSVNYSDLELVKASNLDLDNEFSKVKIGSVNVIETDVSYGSLTVDNVQKMEGDFEFSSLNIGNVRDILILDISYAKALNIDNISTGIRQIEIDSEYSNMNLTLPRNLKANLEAEVKFGNFNYDKDMIDMIHVEKDFNEKEYSGTIGGGSSQTNIRLEASYGNIKLDFK